MQAQLPLASGLRGKTRSQGFTGPGTTFCGIMAKLAGVHYSEICFARPSAVCTRVCLLSGECTEVLL